MGGTLLLLSAVTYPTPILPDRLCFLDALVHCFALSLVPPQSLRYREHLAQGLGLVDPRTIRVDGHLRTKLAALLVETYIPFPNRWAFNPCFYSAGYLPTGLRGIVDRFLDC